MRALAPLTFFVVLGCNLASGVDEFQTSPPTAASAGAGGDTTTASTGGASSGGGGAGGGSKDCFGLSDNFDGAQLDTTKWNAYPPTNGATAVQADGQLHISVIASTLSRNAGVGSAGRFDLRECAVHVQLVEPIAASGTNAWFFIENGNGDQAGFEQNGLVIFLEAPTVSEPIVFSPDTPIWLRLRWQAGAMLWEISKDGIAWTTQMETKDVFEPSSVRVQLGGAAFAFDGAGVAKFDNLNVPPP